MKRKIALLMCMAMCVGMLQGCGNQAKENSDSAQGASQAVSETAGEEAAESDSNLNAEGFPIVKEPITLTVYGARDQNQAKWDEVLVLQK